MTGRRYKFLRVPAPLGVYLPAALRDDPRTRRVIVDTDGTDVRLEFPDWPDGEPGPLSEEFTLPDPVVRAVLREYAATLETIAAVYEDQHPDCGRVDELRDLAEEFREANDDRFPAADWDISEE